jgi:uncharacterized protein YabE (DUF348 family)
MKSLIHRSATPLGVIIGAIIATFILLVITITVIIVSHVGAVSSDQQHGRLVTIHDRGTEQVILTSAKTVADALKEARVQLDSSDSVEPALTQILVAKDYNVNIYRARPVIVVDGDTKQKIITSYQTPEQIAKSAGITLYPEDKTTLASTDDIIAEGAGLKLTITRATTFSFTLYGQKTTARSQAKTVGDMLQKKGIMLASSDRVSPAASTPLISGLSVRVWREGKQTITVDEAVAFTSNKIQDGDQPVGYDSIQTPGANGSRSVTYEVTIQDGKEVSRHEIASITTQQPVQQVEIIGAKLRFLPYSGGGTKTEWLSQSNIPSESWGMTDYIVGRESGWNPNSINRSSGACGLAQALPCSKVPGNPYNPTDSLNWMNDYVNGRYGGWQGAYNHWLIYRSY